MASVPAQESNPPSHLIFVAQPLLAECLLQLLFLATDEEIHQGKVERSEKECSQRSQQQCRTEENENIATEVEGVAREAVGPRGEECLLRTESNHPHPVHVEVVRGPHP